MSSSDEEERIEHSEGPEEPSRERHFHDEPMAPENREERIYHRHTNTGALVAIAIGIIVLVFGLYLVFTQIQFLSPPFSYAAILIIGIILIAVGAKLVSTRT